MRTIAPLALAAAAIAALPAAAQSTRPAALAKLHAEFALTDVNRDGAVTRAEVAARIDRMTMANGHRLSSAEARQLTGLWFARCDLDHDGRVTMAEAEATMATLFDRYDANHDGVISPAERKAAAARLGMPAKR